ncbi:OmpA family protein [Cytophaga sp. FL35]|uniref:OmpA family protein n=1 Tax=Cytophaga sp. FL35 TaxID=1904456 RepID=UPI0016538467|nr:OmpA family protein [Cytophaga sp. FL35]MBC6998171.1 OmpA family protein [Cytophaga sp. FL35]
MLPRLLVAIIFGFGTSSTFSQNLVLNPSFEAYTRCPEKLGNFNIDVDIWTTPTGGSTDYFNGCSTKMGTPKNFNGAQAADFGKGYAGLYFYAPDDYREYLQAELKSPLVAGTKYEVSFYVSLAEKSDFAIKEFGALFSSHKIESDTKKEFSKRLWYEHKENSYTYLEMGYSNFYSDTQDWILVHTQFEAKGGERFMILGNFKNNRRTRLFKTKKNAKQGAYYYIDMVKVLEIEDSPGNKEQLEGDSLDKKEFKVGETHVFRNVLFVFDEFHLTELAQTELLQVLEYLQDNSKIGIVINGHTDNVGSKSYNKKLSQKRARAVASFLQEKGLSKNRISWNGMGGSKPVSTNDSDEGRTLNRRVEFIFQEMSSN